MNAERKVAIDAWTKLHCKYCIYNNDKGTDFVDCQAEHEVIKGTGIACINYEGNSTIREYLPVVEIIAIFSGSDRETFSKNEFIEFITDLATDPITEPHIDTEQEIRKHIESIIAISSGGKKK